MRRPKETRVAQTAQALAGMSLGVESGAFLGAEEDLLERLAVSRPTLRQAAKIVENDRLLEIRRGTKGGLYAARPDASDAIRQLARYLRLRGATMADIRSVNRLISEEAAALAARCGDAGLRARLDGFAGRIGQADSPGALIRAENELARLVAEMSGNPAIELVMAIGYTFGMTEQGIELFETSAQRELVRELQMRLCRAILDGDADVARLMMRRRSETIGAWLDALPPP